MLSCDGRPRRLPDERGRTASADPVGGCALLRRLFLPRHLVSAETREAFADWPNVRFVGFDRAEVIGHDLIRIGYPRALR